MDRNILEEFYRIVEKDNVETNAPMSKYTTFKVGGPADYVITPNSIAQIKELIQICNSFNHKYYIIGNGSNLLVKDKGYSGVIIQLHKKFNAFRIEENIITVQAGLLLSTLSKVACENSLSGLEFASGIPGTFGGAVTMNAGAYGSEMSHVIQEAKVIDKHGNVLEFTAEELKFGYRRSIIAENGYILVEAKVQLQAGNKCDIQNIMEELTKRRVEKQPLEYPSAGSTFKRPQGHFAGKLIMDAGLAGYRVGDACVSKKHCGFVVNLGNATSQDILTVIEDVKNKVYEKYGVILEPEVKILE